MDSHRPADHDIAERPWADLGHAHLARTSAPLKPQGVRSGGAGRPLGPGQMLAQLAEELKTKKYTPGPVRRAYIRIRCTDPVWNGVVW